MLTGDKLETAENIAMSCRLVDSSKLIRNNEEVNVFAREID